MEERSQEMEKGQVVVFVVKLNSVYLSWPDDDLVIGMLSRRKTDEGVSVQTEGPLGLALLGLA